MARKSNQTSSAGDAPETRPFNPAVGQVGGTFAPPLSDEKLAAYRSAVEGLPYGPVKSALEQLLPCCEKWWGLPESDGARATPHPSGTGLAVPLSSTVSKALEEHVPWDHELSAIQTLFDQLPAEGPGAKELRNMAFHLLWHAKELALGREPLTTDKLR